MTAMSALETLSAGRTTSTAVADEVLARILDPEGEGARVYTAIDPEAVRSQARSADAARARGQAGPLCGVPVSIKNLLDIEGFVTTAGSTILARGAPAGADAVVVRRLRQAGAVIVGHTNMTEFAYSGLGLNPHFGTPGNPFDRARVPGGSSSGAAVSVADGMAAIGIGTDTGGSCRIPAAFCGLVGWKPTARRIPLAGCFPLSQSLDSIGSISASVFECERADAVMAGEAFDPLPAPDLSGLRMAVLENYVLDGLTPHVARAYDRAIGMLGAAGARLQSLRLPDLARLPELNARGGIIAAEALAVHRERLAQYESDYDRRVATRIRKAEQQGHDEYEDLLLARGRMIRQAQDLMGPFDAVLMPTVAIEAPLIVDCDADEAYFGQVNLLALRNTTVANFLDCCAISLPIPGEGLPVGLMLMGRTLADRPLFAAARTVEAALRG